MEETKKNLLIVTTTLPRWEGDSEARFVLDHAQALQEYYNIRIIAPYCEGSKKYEKIDDIAIFRYRYFFKETLCYGAGVLPNFKKSISNKIQAPLLVISLYLTIKKHIHWAHAINAWWSIPNGLISTLFNKPTTLTCAGTDIMALTGTLSKINNYIFKKASRVVVLSTALQKKIPHAKVIPVGINIEQFPLKTTEEKNQWLCVGRLTKQKGFDLAIQALTHFPNDKLTIIGEGNELTNLQSLTQQLNLTNRVEFKGPIPNNQLYKHYQQAELLIMPSKGYEALGLVAAEAIACGTPVIASNVGGIPNIVIENKTGYLFEDNNLQDLIQKIKQLKQKKPDPTQARKHIEQNFTWTTIKNKYNQLITEAINE